MTSDSKQSLFGQYVSTPHSQYLYWLLSSRVMLRGPAMAWISADSAAIGCNSSCRQKTPYRTLIHWLRALIVSQSQTFCQTGCSTHGPNFVWFLLIYLRIKHTIEIGCLKTSNLSPLSLIHYMNLIDQTGLWLNSFDTVCWKNWLKPEKKKTTAILSKAIIIFNPGFDQAISIPSPCSHPLICNHKFSLITHFGFPFQLKWLNLP